MNKILVMLFLAGCSQIPQVEILEPPENMTITYQYPDYDSVFVELQLKIDSLINILDKELK